MRRISAPTAAHVNGGHARHHGRQTPTTGCPKPGLFALGREIDLQRVASFTLKKEVQEPYLAKHPWNPRQRRTTVSHTESARREEPKQGQISAFLPLKILLSQC